MEPVEALERIAELLQRVRNARPKVQAFRRAADAIRDVPVDELRALADAGQLTDLPDIGRSSAAVITEALAGKTPEYLTKLDGSTAPPTEPIATCPGRVLRAGEPLTRTIAPSSVKYWAP